MSESSKVNSAPAPAGTGPPQTDPSGGKGKSKRAASPLEATKAWVADIIREATTKDVHEDLKASFISGTPDMSGATVFFERVNKKIRDANKDHNTDSEHGVIPETAYQSFFGSFQDGLEKAKLDNNFEAAWKVFDDTRQKFQAFNQHHGLPAEWNISSSFVEEKFRPTVIQSVEDNDTDSLFEGNLPDHMPMPDFNAMPVDHDVSDDDVSESSEITDLDELEGSARQELSFQDGKVLFWWKRGTGSQVFVRYGSESNGIYRIRAGSNEPYDQDDVPCLLSSDKKGQQKEELQISEKRKEERFKWGREDVHGIIGVGWKIEDDDEEGLEPLDNIWPQPYAKYPHTRILVQWKTKEVTLEDRSFIRRITKGSSLQGDRVIYQKALTQEIRFRREEGLPFEYLLGRDSGKTARQDSMLRDEDFSEYEEEVQDESSRVSQKDDVPAKRASTRPNSARPLSRERSKISEVRFAEPFTRATPRKGSARPASNRAYSKSIEREDPRDAEINFLRQQIESMQKTAYGRPPGRRPSWREYGNRYDDYRSQSSEYEVQPQRSHQMRRGKIWDNLRGRWVASRTY